MDHPPGPLTFHLALEPPELSHAQSQRLRPLTVGKLPSQCGFHHAQPPGFLGQPGLSDCHSEKFEELYTSYESQGRFRRQIKARELWAAIIEAQIETGNPYMLFKDAANSKSNQKNLGTIKSSNLCTEILEFTSPDEVAVCNLASIALPRFVDEKTGTFDHDKLFDVTYQPDRLSVHELESGFRNLVRMVYAAEPTSRRNAIRQDVWARRQGAVV